MERLSRRLILVLAVCVPPILAGCSVSREQRLRDRSVRISDTLSRERQRILESDVASDVRASRLDHFNSLKASLTAVNLALGSVNRLPVHGRDMAYDVIEVAYDTIEWNIPLGPGDRPRPMPDGLADGKLRLTTPP
ncbi:MAG: hypothetical protein KF787_11805 [Phycisphaeraceae bacterium]|nr:hypothetical protein [Phycisphaerae bacterium]MBX3393319.1 hypothetical protein [Phycisphaeraceae bacterium]HRJ50301.1 hypothetical protein [Phycisphaerales bacterium]